MSQDHIVGAINSAVTPTDPGLDLLCRAVRREGRRKTCESWIRELLFFDNMRIQEGAEIWGFRNMMACGHIIFVALLISILHLCCGHHSYRSVIPLRKRMEWEREREKVINIHVLPATSSNICVELIFSTERNEWFSGSLNIRKTKRQSGWIIICFIV